jgi:hypothetical protein
MINAIHYGCPLQLRTRSRHTAKRVLEGSFVIKAALVLRACFFDAQVVNPDTVGCRALSITMQETSSSRLVGRTGFLADLPIIVSI